MKIKNLSTPQLIQWQTDPADQSKRKKSSVGEPLEFVFKWVNSWTKVDPAVPLFDLSTLRKILAKNHLISRTFLVGPVLVISESQL